MKNIFFLISLLISFSALAQTIPALPKYWKGVSNHTSLDKKSGEDLIKTSTPATYEVLKQDGRSVLLLFKSAIYQGKVIGTISADGKQLQIVYANGSGAYTVTDKIMSGCGVSRNPESTLKDGVAPYSAWCNDFVALN
jgi:hypothetical protein